MQKLGLIPKDARGGRYLDIVLTEVGRDAIKASAPAIAARVRKLFIDVLGRSRLAMLRQAAKEVIAAVDEHTKTDYPPEIRSR